MTFHPLKNKQNTSITGPPAQPGSLVNRGIIVWAAGGTEQERVHSSWGRIRSLILSQVLTTHTSIPQPFLSSFSRQNFTEKQNVDLQVLQLTQILWYQGVQDSGEELKLGLSAQDSALQHGQEPGDLLKGLFLGFLPALLCLVPIAVWFLLLLFFNFRKTATQMTWQPGLCLFKCMAFNIAAGTHSSCIRSNWKI